MKRQNKKEKKTENFDEMEIKKKYENKKLNIVIITCGETRQPISWREMMKNRETKEYLL